MVPYSDKISFPLPYYTSLYSDRRYDDKSNANMDLDDFLVKAYAKQIKELNSSTGRTIFRVTREIKNKFVIGVARFHLGNVSK